VSDQIAPPWAKRVLVVLILPFMVQDGRASESQEPPIGCFRLPQPRGLLRYDLYSGEEVFVWAVADGVVLLSEAGRIAEEEWLRTAEKRPYVTLDTHVVMPHHVHGLIIIGEHANNATPHPAGSKSHSLPSIVGGFKSASSRRIAVLSGSYRSAVWQRSYYERIVRDIGELNRIRKYIANNPARWCGGM
jgi:REP element-mobilizing transposase RayT